MANAFLTPKVYAQTMMTLLENNLVLGNKVNTVFKNEFKSIGTTVSVKRPPEFIIANGPNIVVQDIVEGETQVTIDQQKHVAVALTSLEDTLTVSSLLKSSVMQSAAVQLAQAVETAIATQALYFPSFTGTPGTTINSPQAIFRAAQRLEEFAVPGDDLNAFLSSADGYGLASSLSPNNNNYIEDVARTALQKAKVPLVANLDVWRSQSIATLTTGTRTNGTVNGAGQNVTYLSVRSTLSQPLVISGIGAGATVSVGDVFTIAGVYAINPRTKAALPYLQQFTVITAATADGSGNATVQIQNPIITTGAFQNVSAAPANGAAVTWLGAASTNYLQNFACHKQAITLAYAKLTNPSTGACDYATSDTSGVTVRYWRSSDITTDTHYHRWDILFGVKNVDPRLGTRLAG